MKIFYLDCGGRTRFTSKLINHLLKHDYDIIFLADAIDIVDDIKKSLSDYHLYKTHYQYGINILSKEEVKITDFSLKSNHKEVDKKYTMDKYKERLISVEYLDKKFIVVKAPKRKPYKQIFIVNLIKLAKTLNPDLIIGNFSTGYLEDALDDNSFKFTTGYIAFASFENAGYTDPLKGKNEYTYESERGDRERIDHVFTCVDLDEAKYIDMLYYGYDHKAIKVKL
ncbi:MAG: endonuclease/exonuclease/phosphatase family protein [Bacilli bacterium]|nr:endonuclease/exonuclease/phosphatase family protein [Bacilli bacterium]